MKKHLMKIKYFDHLIKQCLDITAAKEQHS